MEDMRESWTDERLDDLNGGMADFRRETKEEFTGVRREMRDEFQAVRREMKEEFQAVRREMKEEFRVVRSEMKAEFRAVREEMKDEFRAFRSEMREEFGLLHVRFDAMQRTMIQVGGGIAAAFGAALIGLIATQL